jgi:hypothetical protein
VVHGRSCCSSPFALVGYQLPDASRDRVGVDHVLDGGPPVCSVSIALVRFAFAILPAATGVTLTLNTANANSPGNLTIIAHDLVELTGVALNALNGHNMFLHT